MSFFLTCYKKTDVPFFSPVANTINLNTSNLQPQMCLEEMKCCFNYVFIIIMRKLC